MHGLDLVYVHAVQSPGALGVEERDLLVAEHHLLHGAAPVVVAVRQQLTL